MELVNEASRPVFNTAAVEKGHLLYAKHRSWEEGKGGIVTRVSEDMLTIQFTPGIGNVMNHFSIPASEAADGQWEIRWSEDLSEVHSYPEGSETPEDGTEQEGGDGT